METLNFVLSQFDLSEKISEIQVISNGFINSTYKIICENSSYILQKININVFPNVENLMHNISLVTAHIYQKNSRGMRVIPTVEGKMYFCFNDDFYRMYNFVENSKAYNSVENPEIFFQTGVGFGKFQNDLADFDASLLYDVIADFHNTPKRLDNFKDAVEKDTCGRAKTAIPEIEYLIRHSDFAGIICDKLDSGELPYRVTHNDTKLNNILFDAQTGEPICAVDLDTVMSGSVLFDFGDAIRYGANPAGELGTDAPRVYIDLDLYRAFLDGFLRETHNVLTNAEIELLPESVLVMSYELALRFLEDYLRGDVYFGEAFKNINLQRARVQIELVENVLQHFDQLKNITAEVYSKYLQIGK